MFANGLAVAGMPSELIPALVFDSGVSFLLGFVLTVLLAEVYSHCVQARELLAANGAGATYSEDPSYFS